MKQYPKIPRHNHPVLDGFFESGEAYITEKYDGTNFRFALYEERFEKEYLNSRFNQYITDVDPKDGELVYGTKRNLRGTSRTPLSEIDGNLNRIVKHLKSTVDVEAIKKIQDEYGPVIFFCEGMVLHSLDYGYLENPPPPLVGFDVYSFRRDSREKFPKEPYEETFEGFFETPKSMEFFEQINLTPATPSDELTTMDLETFDPETYEIPESRIGEVQAEGIVFRKIGAKERAKFVSEEFKELNSKAWGLTEDEAETGAERFVAIFCTPARIRKNILKLVNEEGYEFSREIIEDVYPVVIEDIWQEEWREIKDLNFEFNPSEVKPLIAKQCAETVKRMETNAKLNNTPIDTLWQKQN